MFGGGISAIGAISSFANSSNSNSTSAAINNGFVNGLSSNKPPVLNGTNIANSINGFNSNANTTSSGSVVGQMKNLIDATYTIINRIETTNILLQKLIDINSGKVQQNDINKIAATNNRISIAMSRTAMGRLAMAVMAKQLGKNLGNMDYRMRNAIDSGVTSNKEILTAKLLGNLPLIGKMFTSMKEISDKVLRAKDIFTNETNIAITKIIPDRLEAIGTYTRDIRDFLKKDMLRELMLQTHALLTINSSVNNGFNRLSGIGNGNAPQNTPQIIIPGQASIANAVRDTTDAINVMRDDISSALDIYNEQNLEINALRIKTDKQLQKAALDQIELQKTDNRLTLKLTQTSDKILDANVQTKALLSGIIIKLPNILGRSINTALKLSLMMGIGRTIFRAFGANKIAENISAEGAVGFMAASTRFIKGLLDRMMNSKIGKSITSFIDKQIQFIKEKMMDAISYGVKQALRLYNTFVIMPKLFREHIIPILKESFKSSKSRLVEMLAPIEEAIRNRLIHFNELMNAQLDRHMSVGSKFVISKVMKTFGVVGKAFAFIAKNATKMLSIAGIVYSIYSGVKEVIGTMFSAWKLTKSKTELEGMSIGEQVYQFTKDMFSALGKAVTGSVKFLWNNLGPIISGFVKGLFDWIYDSTIGAISRWWNGASKREAMLNEAIEEQNKQMEEEKQNTAEAIEQSKEEATKNSNSLKNALIENLQTINKAIVKGFSYVIKIFDLFKPKTLGSMSGNILGGISETIKVFMTDKQRKSFDDMSLTYIKGKLKEINEAAIKANPALKDTVKFDELGRPISGDVDSFYKTLENLGKSAEFKQSMYDSWGYSPENRFGEQFKESTKESFNNVLNDKEVRINKLLEMIQKNTENTAAFTGAAVGMTKNQIAMSKGKAIDLYNNQQIWDDSLTSKYYKMMIDSPDKVAKEDANQIFSGMFDQQIKGRKTQKLIAGQLVDVDEGPKDISSVYNEAFNRGDGTTTKDALNEVKSKLLDKMYVNDRTSVGHYSVYFKDPKSTGNAMEDIKNFQRYHSFMTRDLFTFYNTFLDGLKNQGVDESMFSIGNGQKDADINPNAYFHALVTNALANFAKQNANIYNMMSSNPGAYEDYFASVIHQMYEAGSTYGMGFKEYVDLSKNQRTTVDADNLKKRGMDLVNLISIGKQITFGNIANSRAMTREAEEARRKVAEEEAMREQGDDVIYGDWRSYTPKTFGDWRDSIYIAAQRTGLDPELISAIIQQESGGRVNAKSDKNAYGLMQLRPAAVIDAHKHLGIPQGKYSVEVPEDNVMLGSAYMGMMLGGSNDLVDAMMRYNWGIGNFKKWKSSNGAISAVPSEAREYPGKVLRYYGAHKFTDPKTPINRQIHIDFRNRALLQAGLKGAINPSSNSNIPPSADGMMEGSVNVPAGSNDRTRASKFIQFSGTNIDKFMMVNPLMREPFLRYAEEMFKTYNRKVVVTSAYRSIADQTRLWNNRANNPNTVGRPNQYNKHHLGLAIDISSRDGYSINDTLLNKYGMVRPLGKKDPVHVEMRKWANIRGLNLVNQFGDYPKKIGAPNPVNMDDIPNVKYSSLSEYETVNNSAADSNYYATVSNSVASNNTPMNMSNTLSGLITQKLQSYGINTNNPDGYANALSLMSLVGDDTNYGNAAEPVNFTGLTAGLRNTTFENELRKIELAGIANARMRKVTNNTSQLESQLTKVMALLAKKTVENNELMKQIVATNTTNVVTISNNNTNNTASSVSSGNSGASTNNNSNLDNGAMMAGNDMGLRALYI